jgi:hypothetical protein
MPLGNESVVDRLERLGIDAKRELLVVTRQELARAAGPELDTSVGARESRAEQAGDENDRDAIGRRGVRRDERIGGMAKRRPAGEECGTTRDCKHANRRRTGSNSG